MQCNKDIIVCLVGPSGVGKTTVAFDLEKKYEYNVIKSFTTRPPRYLGEEGHTFVEKSCWEDIEVDFDADVIAYSEYNGHCYWATREQYRGKGISIYVIDVPGVEMLRKSVKDAEIIVIALWADEETRFHRLVKRGDSLDAIEDRLLFDDDAFAIIPSDYTIDANKDVDIVAKRVNKCIFMSLNQTK